MIIGVIRRRPVIPGRVRLRLAPAWQVVIRGLVTGVVTAWVAVVPGPVPVLAGVAWLVRVAVLAWVVTRVGIVLPGVAGLSLVVRVRVAALAGVAALPRVVRLAGISRLGGVPGPVVVSGVAGITGLVVVPGLSWYPGSS